MLHFAIFWSWPLNNRGHRICGCRRGIVPISSVHSRRSCACARSPRGSVRRPRPRSAPSLPLSRLVLRWINADFRVQIHSLQHFWRTTRIESSKCFCLSFFTTVGRAVGHEHLGSGPESPFVNILVKCRQKWGASASSPQRKEIPTSIWMDGHDTITLSGAPSRLDRRRFSRPNTHFAAFFKIYKKIIFSRANLQNICRIFQKFGSLFFFQKFQNFEFSENLRNLAKFCSFFKEFCKIL